MKQLSLSKYAPIISDKDLGNEIYNQLNNYLSGGKKVELDLAEIKSMATFCAKQIFGRLYVELGPQDFFDRLILKNANNDIKTIIKIGIQHTLADTDNK